MAAEQLFSSTELAAIIKEATVNEKSYLDRWAARNNVKTTSISTISANKRLVFTEVNDDTGYRHLRERHTLFTYKNYWIKTADGEIKRDRPSKFHPAMAPGIDYMG